MYDDEPPPVDWSRYDATLYDFEYRSNWPLFIPYSEIQENQQQEEADWQRSTLP